MSQPIDPRKTIRSDAASGGMLTYEVWAGGKKVLSGSGNVDAVKKAGIAYAQAGSLDKIYVWKRGVTQPDVWGKEDVLASGNHGTS